MAQKGAAAGPVPSGFRPARRDATAGLLVLGPAVAAASWAALAVRTGEPWWHAAVDTVVVVAPAAVGATLAARLPRNPLGWLLLTWAGSTGLAGVLSAWADSRAASPAGTWAAWGNAVLWGFQTPVLVLIVLLFPDGRPRGRAGRWGVGLAATGIALVVALSATAPGPLAAFSTPPGPPNPLGIPGIAAAVSFGAGAAFALLLTAGALALLTLGCRWHGGRAEERLPLAIGGAPLAAAVALHAAGGVTGLAALAITGTLVAAIGVPLALGVAVTRYRLYDLDLAATRTLAHALLVLLLTLLFGATVAVIGLVARGRPDVAWAAATAVTVVAVVLVRRRLVVLVQRSVLGPIGDPDRAAAEIGIRLAAVSDPDDIPACVVAGVSDVLHIPVGLAPPGRPARTGAGESWPVSRHGVELGVLTVLAPLSAAGRLALAAVTVPVAAALHAAALSETVRRSRADLVTAVEDERRRLRRDLHDGLGPRLATLGMGLDAARNHAERTDAAELTALLCRLRAQTDEMLGALRRIVSELRPPALDDLGLTEALRRYADEVTAAQGFSVEIVAEHVQPLPAAVEAAAYRIAAEAVLNAVRHSGGSHCHLRLTEARGRDGAGLSLEVTDDGAGAAADRPAGVGTQAMRERAAAVGGWVTTGPAAGGGTAVRAWLPLVAA